MNVADIITEFGAYYLSNGQNMADLVKKLYRKSTTDQLFTQQITQNDILRKSESSFSRVLQPFQKTWSPVGTATFKPSEIALFKQKIDVEETPDDLMETWLGFLAGDGIDRKQWPFVKWLLEVHILPKAEEDYELNEVYSGVYAAPGTPGTAGASGTAMNGIKKTINDLITASKITPIPTGAPNSDPQTWVEQVEAFVKSVDKRYWKQPMQLAMSEDLEERFKTGMEKKYNTYYKMESDVAMVKHFQVSIVGLPSMTGATKIWMTPKENAGLGVKRINNQSAANVESVDRKVKLFSDWSKGLGFWIPDLVFTNDRDLV